MDAQQETRVMFILDERSGLREIEREKAVPVERKAKFKIKNAFEVFVPVKGFEDYWISNYGRCITDINRKKDNYHLLKEETDCYKLISYTKRIINEKVVEDRWIKDIQPKYLVAKTFLKEYPGRTKIWFRDGNKKNCWYKNLIYVSNKDYWKLNNNRITLEELQLEQEYIEYENKATSEAYRVYYRIRQRCTENHRHYEEVEMCQEWLDNPKSFVEWYFKNYYSVGNETMCVDKDLFSGENKIYSPDTCCILPITLNSLIASMKKRSYDEEEKNKLPLGVRYNSTNDTYYGEVQPPKEEYKIKLSEWATPEEAFQEYRLLRLKYYYEQVLSYRKKIPQHIYKELMKVDIKPY